VPVSETAAQDLKRIRGIDAATEQALRHIGVTRYEHVSKWRAADVARVSMALGVKGRVERENWIEQAHILARGDETYFSRRMASAQSRPEPQAIPVARIAPSPAIVTTAKSEPSPPASPAAAPPATARVPATTPVPVRAPEKVAEPAAARVEERAAFAEERAPSPPPQQSPPAPAVRAAMPPLGPLPPVAPPPRTAEPRPVPQRPVPPQAPAAQRPISPAPPAAPGPSATPPTPAAIAAAANPAAAAVSPPTPPTSSGRDTLQRIGGISAEIEKTLNAQGISRYSQIAGWMDGDREKIEQLLGISGRIGRENWVEQAQVLARGGSTAQSRDWDRRTTPATSVPPPSPPKPIPTPTPVEPVPPPPPRPVNLAEAIRESTGRPREAPPSPPSRPSVPNILPQLPAAAPARPVARPPQAPPPAMPPSAAAAAQPGPDAARPPRPAPPRADAGGSVDDLKRIRGIGVLIEKKLNALGIARYGQIANWSQDDVARISEQLDFKGRIERESWVEQARILAAGGQTEFSRRVDRGEL